MKPLRSSKKQRYNSHQFHINSFSISYQFHFVLKKHELIKKNRETDQVELIKHELIKTNRETVQVELIKHELIKTDRETDQVICIEQRNVIRE